MLTRVRYHHTYGKPGASVTPQVLLDGLRSLLEHEPGLRGRGHYQREQHEWLGKANALVANWDGAQGALFRAATQAMAGNMNRDMNYGMVQTTLHEAIATIENNLPAQQGQVFGPGAVYDFFVALNELVEGATESLFIVDPFLDNGIFDTYLSSLRHGVSARLLASRYVGSVKAAAAAFRSQHGNEVQVRSSAGLHDRIIFIDHTRCWVLGQSIKDAAKKPTYLAPLPDDVIPEKLRIYEGLWAAATAI